MGHHIDSEGRFQSDKHPLRPDRIQLNFTKKLSQRALWVLAEDYADKDPGLTEDIRDRLMDLGYNKDGVVDGIGDQYFGKSSDCLGHGDIELSQGWEKALGTVNAPDGFVYIVDSELTPVALVPLDRAAHFVALLNQ